MTIGVGRSHSPSRTCRSEWQTPDASIRTRTSPARGSMSSSSCTTAGRPISSRTTARTPSPRLDCDVTDPDTRSPTQYRCRMDALPPGFHWPDGYRAAAMFTFDVDAEAVMLTDHPEVIDYLDVIGHQRYG